MSRFRKAKTISVEVEPNSEGPGYIGMGPQEILKMYFTDATPTASMQTVWIELADWTCQVAAFCVGATQTRRAITEGFYSDVSFNMAYDPFVAPVYARGTAGLGQRYFSLGTYLRDDPLFRVGDCNDFAGMLVMLLEAQGHNASWLVVRAIGSGSRFATNQVSGRAECRVDRL